jgi:hypothetical protein
MTGGRQVRWKAGLGLLCRAWVARRLGGQHGQTTTEWLMIAGVLTAVTIFMIGLFPGALKAMLMGIAYGIRTAAP